MFKYDSIQDFICKSLIGKVLVKVGDLELYEKITKAWHDPDTNSIVVYTDISQTYIYNSSFVLVPDVIEIDWETYINKINKSLTECTLFDDVGGELYTVDEFHDMVQNGTITSSDGFGIPSNGEYELYVQNTSVQVLAACKYSKTVTHISWYNK